MNETRIALCSKPIDGKPDILKSTMHLYTFCLELVEALGSRDAAENWLENQFTQEFEQAIDDCEADGW